MKITIHNGMVTIDDESFAYGSIEKMYLNGQMGVGLQVIEALVSVRDDLCIECSTIAKSIYRIQEMLATAADNNE